MITRVVLVALAVVLAALLALIVARTIGPLELTWVVPFNGVPDAISGSYR